MSLIIIIIIIAILISFSARNRYNHDDYVEQRMAGNAGEYYVGEMIRDCLWETDYLLENVLVTVDDSEAEMDFVIVNTSGVFIIEAKNYRGQIIGEEDEYEWLKIKTTGSGKQYAKPVRNPIKQVQRQIYILKSFLKSYGINVWIEGYVKLVRNNSPIESPYILWDLEDIDRVIHSGQQQLSYDEVHEIVNLVSGNYFES